MQRRARAFLPYLDTSMACLARYLALTVGVPSLVVVITLLGFGMPQQDRFCAFSLDARVPRVSWQRSVPMASILLQGVAIETPNYGSLKRVSACAPSAGIRVLCRASC